VGGAGLAFFELRFLGGLLLIFFVEVFSRVGLFLRQAGEFSQVVREDCPGHCCGAVFVAFDSRDSAEEVVFQVADFSFGLRSALLDGGEYWVVGELGGVGCGVAWAGGVEDVFFFEQFAVGSAREAFVGADSTDGRDVEGFDSRDAFAQDLRVAGAGFAVEPVVDDEAVGVFGDVQGVAPFD
jgi:hypothetical protein